MSIKENGSDYRTDLSVAQPPCSTCRHAGLCDLTPRCHALKYYEINGATDYPAADIPWTTTGRTGTSASANQG